MDVDRAARIASLKQHPAWAELVAAVDEQHERYAVNLAKKMLATGTPYDNFEYKRGYLAALKAITRYPDQAIIALAKDAEAQAREQAEAAEEEAA